MLFIHILDKIPFRVSAASSDFIPPPVLSYTLLFPVITGPYCTSSVDAMSDCPYHMEHWAMK